MRLTLSVLSLKVDINNNDYTIVACPRCTTMEEKPEFDGVLFCTTSGQISVSGEVRFFLLLAICKCRAP